MREIVFDTETTGFEPNEGHRIVEIGLVELVVAEDSADVLRGALESLGWAAHR